MATVHDPDDQAAIDSTPGESSDLQIDVVDVSAPKRPPWRRRRYQAAAAIGVVAALGTGVLLARDTGSGHGDADSADRVGQAQATSGITVTNSGSMPKDHHTLRVVSARKDLSGQHELAWAADSGHPVGDARCTQNFRIGPSSSARVRPTMLLCWRTSADRSVFTVAVDLDQRPSEQASVATISKVWATLG